MQAAGRRPLSAAVILRIEAPGSEVARLAATLESAVPA